MPMTKLLLSLIFSVSFFSGSAQTDFLIFKKKNKSLATFWKGSVISFQLRNKQWQKGQIIKIQNDSIYIKPVVVYYGLIGTDTIHYNVAGYPIADILAMPKKGILIDYKNGHFQISRSGGNISFYWVKSGLIFRIGAVTYTALTIINGLLTSSFSLTGSKFGIAAVVFAGGLVLHKTWKPVLPVGKKYHLKVVSQ